MDKQLCIHWLERSVGMSSHKREIARVQDTLTKIKAESKNTGIRSIIVIDEDDNTRAWWKNPMHNIFTDVKYSVTFCEMCSSEDMKNKVIEEQKKLHCTLYGTKHHKQNYRGIHRGNEKFSSQY